LSKKDRLKKPKQDSNRLTPHHLPNYDKKPLVFSLERLQSGSYCLSKLEKDDRAAFADSIFKRRLMTYVQLISEQRHGLGTEKIAKHSIKASIPKFITDDFNYFIAFRFNGKKSMVGYKVNNVFYVLWFDHDFSLYDHR